MASFQPVFNLESDKIQPSYQSLTNLCCFGICNLCHFITIVAYKIIRIDIHVAQS